MRARDHGFVPGLLPTGPANAITDVPGVRVGHANHQPDHTGVTAIWPHDGDPWLEPYYAATGILNGAGEIAGKAQIDEWGLIETPIFLTGTVYVGSVYASAVHVLRKLQPRIDEAWIIPVVSECDPSSWCDMARGPEPDDRLVDAALASASAGAVSEGQIGAGVGMESFGFAGGIGTSSRVVEGFTVGVLLLSNFGLTERLTVCGHSVGASLLDRMAPQTEGSCVCLTATDAPLVPHQLARLAKRAFLGLARTGSYGSHGSGEVAIAWTTQNRLDRDDRRAVRDASILADRTLSLLFAGAMEAGEEAVLNVLCAGRDLTGFDGRTLTAFPAAEVAASIRSR